MNINSIYTIKKVEKQLRTGLQNILYLNVFQVHYDLKISLV